MECDLLIDFNSPQKGGVNVLDPLVPLPKVQARDLYNNESVSSIGDNPFDNVFLQLCREDDPFDMIEKRAKETKVETISKDSSIGLQTISLIHKDYKQGIQGNLGLAQKSSPKINRQSLSYDASDTHHSSLFCEKSGMESCFSPRSAGIENKFSKLYMSTQFDKQILEESSKCIDSGMHDVSLEITYPCDVSSRSNKAAGVLALDLPNKDDEIKAFIANRIEKCIEKAVTETRKSLNSSHKHRRSLSAASVYPSYEPSAINIEKNILPSLVLNNSKWSSSFSGKNKSLSNHDLPSLQNTNLWKNLKGNINLYGNEKFISGVSDKFNTGFRKSTATSSMYSSFGLLDTGFHLNSSLFRNAKSSSSVYNVSSPQVGEDSVFINNDMLDRKSSDCVLMEAKNLSFLLQRRVRSAGDEPLDNDYNFLSDNKCDIELVDSSFSENEDANLSLNNNENVHPENSLLAKENKLTTSLKSNVLLVKTSHSVILAPPLPVPINSSSYSRELVLRPRGHSDGRVISKGPMKAMIPLGSMVRTSSEKERNLSTRQDEGNEHKKADSKLVPSCSSVKKSAKEERVSQSNKFISPASSRLNSPLGQPYGRPVACSTPASEITHQLASPPVALQVSNISPSSPTKQFHRRSRSAGNKDGNVLETESKLISTPTRKVPRRIRSEDGRLKSKQKSPPLLSPKPAYTSTPLKPITRNSPPVNRMKKNAPITRKVLQHKEKENIQPHRPGRGLKLLSRNSRI